MNNDIFRHADKSLMVIYADMAKRFQRLVSSLGFDELNVMDTRDAVNALYKALDALIRREYRKIAKAAYKEAGGAVSDFDAHEFVTAILRAYDPLSDFVYNREYTRKRDRLFESIIATQTGNQQMRRVLKRNMDVLANQIRQYADNITIQARIQAFRDTGVEYVRWVTEKDEKVCSVCASRDGVVYRLDEIADLIPAHWHCRCQLQIASAEDWNERNADARRLSGTDEGDS